MKPRFTIASVVLSASVASWSAAQQPTAPQAPPPGPPLQLVQPEAPAGPPAVITLPDALARAKANEAQFQASVTEAASAHEDRLQARAATLPTITHTTQELLTKGNGVLPTGRYVTNDGVHVYRSWGVLHQEISPNVLLGTPVRRARAAEALADAKVEIAQRGLAVTVTRAYYTLVTAQRQYATAQQAAQQASRFLDISQRQERLGQVAHSDAVKAEIQFGLQQQRYADALVAMENARLALAVLLSPTLNENFTVIDDLANAPALPPFAEARARAERENPDLRAATAAVDVAHDDVQLARHAFLPSLAIDADYGIEANAFALRSVVASFPQAGPLPNLGFFVTANISVPVWDWGGLRSKLRQTEIRERQAHVELTQAERQAMSSLYSFYNEALAARSALDNLQHVADLAAESLRLTDLRYEAGESTALEVVDAQNTLVQARTAYDDAGLRYRVALASLQTLTGSF